MKEGGYPKDVRAGEEFKGLNPRGTRHSENATPKAEPVGKNMHSASVQEALVEGIASGKGHEGRKASASGARPPGTNRGPTSSRGSLKHEIAKGSPDRGGTAENPYGYDGSHSRGKLHDWKGNRAPAHPQAHAPIEGGHKHDHKTQLPAGVPHAHHMSDGKVDGSHGYHGQTRKGVHRLSGHPGAHMLGGKRGGSGIFGKKG